VNDKLILIIGSDVGNISAYYIDEKPATGETSKHMNKMQLNYNNKKSKEEKERNWAYCFKSFSMEEK
jgi:hypothetical protein